MLERRAKEEAPKSRSSRSSAMADSTPVAQDFKKHVVSDHTITCRRRFGHLEPALMYRIPHAS